MASVSSACVAAQAALRRINSSVDEAGATLSSGEHVRAALLSVASAVAAAEPNETAVTANTHAAASTSMPGSKAPPAASTSMLASKAPPAASTSMPASKAPRAASTAPASERTSQDLSAFLSFLLAPRGVLDTWLPALGPRARATCIDALFDSSVMMPKHVIPALLAPLRAEQADRGPAAAEAARQLALGIQRRAWFQQALERQQKEGASGAEWRAFIALLCRVPDVVANALHRTAPAFLYPSTLFPHVAACALQHVAGQLRKARGKALPQWTAAQDVLQRLLLAGRVADVAACWVDVAVTARVQQGAAVGGGWSSPCSAAVWSLCIPAARVPAMAAALCRRLSASYAASLPYSELCGVVRTVLVPAPMTDERSGSTAVSWWWTRGVSTQAMRRALVRAVVDVSADVLPLKRFRALLHHAARVWSGAHFATHGNLPVQRGATTALVRGIAKLAATGDGAAWLAAAAVASSAASDRDSEELVGSILAGVQVRFAASDKRYHALGRRVAAAFAAVASPAADVDFGSDDDSDDSGTDWEDEGEDVPETAPDTAPAVPAVAAAAAVATDAHAWVAPKETARGVDLEEVLLSDSGGESANDGSESDDDAASAASATSDDSDDSDLVPYDMEGIDTPKGPQFVYLRDYISGLREKEEFERAQAALYGMEAHVRRAQSNSTTMGELREVAVPLARTLLLLEDRFKLPMFEACRTRSLVALCVAVPVAVAGYITRQVYAMDRSLSQRMLALDVLALAARELAGGKLGGGGPGGGDDQASGAGAGAGNQAGRAGNAPGDQMSGRGTAAGNKASGIAVGEGGLGASTGGAGAGAGGDAGAGARPALVGRVTRRWGRRKKPLVKSVNRFADVAPKFFFPLLAGVRKGVRGLDILGKDAMMLASLLRVLAAVLECARHALSVRDMIVKLLDLVWHVRFHDEPAVRQASLVALAGVVRALGRNTALVQRGDGVMERLGECAEWVAASTTKDPDPECRRVAASILQSGALQQAQALAVPHPTLSSPRPEHRPFLL